MNGELPLRIIDQPGGAIIRCLCGAEGNRARREVVEIPGARMAVPMTGLSPDVTPAGVLSMIVHAKRCERGQQIAAEQVTAARNMRIPVANVTQPE